MKSEEVEKAEMKRWRVREKMRVRGGWGTAGVAVVEAETRAQAKDVALGLNDVGNVVSCSSPSGRLRAGVILTAQRI